MKIKAKFFPSYTFFLTPKIEFQGKGLVHLHEMGIHAEGDLPRFTLPIIGRFYAPLFNARTSRTIPYSRITSYQYLGNWINITVGKILLLLLLWLGVGLLSIALWMSPTSSESVLLAYQAFVWGVIVLITILLLFKDRKKHRLLYRLPDGKTKRILFRQTHSSFAQIQEFRNMLEDYRSKATSIESVDKPHLSVSS